LIGQLVDFKGKLVGEEELWSSKVVNAIFLRVRLWSNVPGNPTFFIGYFRTCKNIRILIFDTNFRYNKLR